MDRGKDGHGHVYSQNCKHCGWGSPSLFFFFFFLSYSLSLWVPQGGGVRMASSSTEAGNTSDPMGKLGIGLATWVTPLQVGA